MNVGEIRRRVKNIVGDESGVFIEDPDLLDYINDGQLDIVRRIHVLQTNATISTIVNTDLYAVPADFILEKRVTYLGTRMKKTSLEEIDSIDVDKDLTSNVGTPTWYYFAGNKIGFYPTPSSSVANPIKLTYVRAPTALALDADIPEIPVHMHEDIVRFCVLRAREQEEEASLLSYASQEYQTRLGISEDQAKAPTGSSYPAVRDIDAGLY
jgi:hypothetical protein